jgi:hypothetical protein
VKKEEITKNRKKEGETELISLSKTTKKIITKTTAFFFFFSPTNNSPSPLYSYTTSTKWPRNSLVAECRSSRPDAPFAHMAEENLENPKYEE